MDPRCARIVDANLNRLAEGLRVVEDVCRLATTDRRLLVSVRALRGRVGRQTLALRRDVIEHRSSQADPGRPARFDRGKRRGLEDVLAANLKRCEEAARTLEEVLKIDKPELAARLKAVRFRLYAIEKRAVLAVRRSAID